MTFSNLHIRPVEYQVRYKALYNCCDQIEYPVLHRLRIQLYSPLYNQVWDCFRHLIKNLIKK